MASLQSQTSGVRYVDDLPHGVAMASSRLTRARRGEDEDGNVHELRLQTTSLVTTSTDLPRRCGVVSATSAA